MDREKAKKGKITDKNLLLVICNEEIFTNSEKDIMESFLANPQFKTNRSQSRFSKYCT